MDMCIHEIIVRQTIIPFIVHLYDEAKIEMPVVFDPDIEGPRLVASLRAQGFASQFERDVYKRSKG